MRDYMTTLLDLLGLLAIAAGVGAAAGYVIGWAGIAVSGVVLIVGSQLIAWLGRPAKRTDR